MRWPGIEAIYGSTLRATKVFGADEDGNKRWEELHTRVIEHVSLLAFVCLHTVNLTHQLSERSGYLAILYSSDPRSAHVITRPLRQRS